MNTKLIKIACLNIFLMSCGLQAMDVQGGLNSLLIRAAKKRDAQEEVEQLLAKKANIDAQDPNFKITPLMEAALEGNYEAAQLLISKKANLEMQDFSGMTALLLATAEGHEDICKLLIAHQANLETQIADSEDPYDQEYKGTLTALMLAAKNNRLDVCKLLIAQKANINAQDAYGRTALKFAVEYGHYEICKLLIENAAQVNNLPNDTRQTALMWAAQEDRYEICKLLIDNGADVYAHDKKNYTALMWANASPMTFTREKHYTIKICKLIIKAMIKHDQMKAAIALYDSLKKSGKGKDVAQVVAQQLRALQKGKYQNKTNAESEINKIPNPYFKALLLECLESLN